MKKISSVAEAVSFVRTAGRHALEQQQELRMSDRLVKADNSVVTTIDREIGEYLRQKISDAFPTANVIGEESEASATGDAAYTFAVDPIDGTDSFSQGMPGWSISIGVLDRQLSPVAGIVYAPAWAGLFFADIDKPATYNGEELQSPAPPQAIDHRTNLLVDSRIHLLVDLEDYPGKLRSMGSTAIHLCGFLLYGAVVGAVSRGARIWDLAGAHAINASLGQSVEYFSGGEVTYDRLIDGAAAPDMVIAGTDAGKRLVRQTLKPRRG